jgi:hypothetical protein
MPASVLASGFAGFEHNCEQRRIIVLGKKAFGPRSNREGPSHHQGGCRGSPHSRVCTTMAHDPSGQEVRERDSGGLIRSTTAGGVLVRSWAYIAVAPPVARSRGHCPHVESDVMPTYGTSCGTWDTRLMSYAQACKAGLLHLQSRKSIIYCRTCRTSRFFSRHVLPCT